MTCRNMYNSNFRKHLCALCVCKIIIEKVGNELFSYHFLHIKSIKLIVSITTDHGLAELLESIKLLCSN